MHKEFKCIRGFRCHIYLWEANYLHITEQKNEKVLTPFPIQKECQPFIPFHLFVTLHKYPYTPFVLFI